MFLMATIYYVSSGGTIYTRPKNPSYAGSSTGGFGADTKTFTDLSEAKEESSIVRTNVQDINGNIVSREYNPTAGIITSTLVEQHGGIPISQQSIPNYAQLGTEIINARVNQELGLSQPNAPSYYQLVATTQPMSLKQGGYITSGGFYTTKREVAQADASMIRQEYEMRRIDIAENFWTKAYDKVVPFTTRGAILTGYGENKPSNIYKEAVFTRASAYGSVLLTPYASPFAVRQGIIDVGYFTGSEEYRDWYMSPQRRQVATYIETRSIQLQNQGDLPFTLDYTEVTGARQMLFGGLAGASRPYKEQVLYEVSNKFGYQSAEFGLRERGFAEFGEFTALVDINRQSNRMATKSYQLIQKRLAKKSVESGLKRSLLLSSSVLPGGAYEGALSVINYESNRYGQVDKKDVVLGAGFGILTAGVFQFALEVPVQTTLGKPKFITSAGKGTNIAEQSGLYAVDWAEGLGDFADILTSGNKNSLRVFVYPFTNIQDKTFSLEGKTVKYRSATLQSEYGFTFGRTQAQPKSVSKSLTTVNNRVPTITRQMNIVSSKTPTPVYELSGGMIKQPRMTFENNFKSTDTPVFNNPFTNPNPIIPVPVDVLPRTQPQTNPFINEFINTNINEFVNTNTFVNTPVKNFPPPFLPPLRDGFGKGFGFNVKNRGKKAYIPSLTAIGFNIRAKKGQKINVASGLGIRPIIS